MSSGSAFIGGMILGIIFEIVFIRIHKRLAKKSAKKRKERFPLINKMCLISIPLWGVFSLIFFRHYEYVAFFVTIIVIGPLLEYIFGKTFYHFYGIKLWIYHYGSLGKYTSIYAVPYWGGAAILFLIIAKYFGI